MRKLDQFQELAPNQMTKWEQCAQNWSQQQRFKGNNGGKHTNWTLTRPNQQQDLDLDTNSTQRTLKLKYAKAMAQKALGQEKTSMALDYGTNAKHSKLGDRCEPDGIPQL